MATRHIKRLQEQQLAKAVHAAEPDDAHCTSEEEEDEEAEQGGVTKAPFNPFDLLSDEDDQASAASESDQCDEQPENQRLVQQPPQLSEQQQQQQRTAAGSSSGRKKKKSKQKDRQTKQQEPADARPAAGGSARHQQPAGTAPAQQDDIDQLLQELNMLPHPHPAASQVAGSGSNSSSKNPANPAAKLPPLLGIDAKKIRGDDELRRIFGAGVIEAVDRMEGGARRGPAGGAAASARAAVRRRQLKRFILVTPADHWPHVDSGISMKQEGTGPDGALKFLYSWSPNYQAAQRVFEQAQASYDPNAVAAVLHQFPYHVDSLLAMNELYRSMGEAQTADDMLSRALYALEGAWPPSFDPTSGRVRLDVEQPANRGLFVALFRHAQALSRRGCHSSALEVTKLLLALDPEDPMGGLLLLDYLALRAGAYAYLERFVSEFDSSHSLALLPNYAFSLPLARFRREQQQQQQQAAAPKGDGPGLQQTAAGASSSKAVSSLTLLAQALLLHPLVLRELIAKLQGQGAAREPIWQQLLARRLFAKASDHGSLSLSHLVSLFVERSHQLWKALEVQAWLRLAAEAAADVADGKRHNSSRPRQQQQQQQQAGGLPDSPDAVEVEGSAEDWACVARESFPATERNEYGHLRLADFSDAVNQLPAEEMQAAMAAAGQGAGDAAELDMLNDMLAQQQLTAQAALADASPTLTEEELRAANPLLVLMQSILPWVNLGQQPDYAADEGSSQQQQPGGAGGANGPAPR